VLTFLTVLFRKSQLQIVQEIQGTSGLERVYFLNSAGDIEARANNWDKIDHSHAPSPLCP